MKTKQQMQIDLGASLWRWFLERGKHPPLNKTEHPQISSRRFDEENRLCDEWKQTQQRREDTVAQRIIEYRERKRRELE